MSSTRFRMFLLLIGLAGVLVIVLATRHGVGLAPDSTTYITEARQLLRGKGLTTALGTPVTHFPPLFPICVAAVSRCGIDAINAARILNLLIFVTNIWLIGTIVGRNAGSLAGGTAAGLAAVCPDLLSLHAWALSEPLFLLLSLWGLWELQRYQSDHKRCQLFVAALLIGAAALTRYAGISLLITGVLMGLKQTIDVYLAYLCKITRPDVNDARVEDSSTKVSIAVGRLYAAILSFRDHCLAMMAAGLPLALWLVRNRLRTDSATNRSMIYHAINAQKWMEGLQTAAAWFGLPLPKVGAITVVVVFVSAVLAVIWANPRNAQAEPVSIRIPWVFGLFVPSYLAVVVFSLCWVDAQIPLDSRMLAPIPAALICFLVPLFFRLVARRAAVEVASGANDRPTRNDVSSTRIQHRRVLIGTLWIAATVVFSISLYREGSWILDSRKHGLGYSSRSWRSSKVMAAIRKLPPDACIYSNAPGAVLLLTDHIAGDIPQKYDRNSTRGKTDYDSRMELMRSQMQAHGGHLAYFRTAGSRHNLPSEVELQTSIPMRVILDENGETLYSARVQ